MRIPNQSTPGRLIKQAREAKHWTQRQVADAVGVTPGFIAKVEANESLPGYERCIKLADVLGIVPDSLWTEVERVRSELRLRRFRTRGAALPRFAATSVDYPADVVPLEKTDMSTAYRHLQTALADSALRQTLLKTLEVFARAARRDAGQGTSKGRIKNRKVRG